MPHPFPALDGSAPKSQKFKEAPEMGIDPSKRYTATMDTTLGQLVIALDPIKAPKTVNNVLTVLNVLLKKAAEWDVIERVPCVIRLLPTPKSSSA